MSLGQKTYGFTSIYIWLKVLEKYLRHKLKLVYSVVSDLNKYIWNENMLLVVILLQ